MDFHGGDVQIGVIDSNKQNFHTWSGSNSPLYDIWFLEFMDDLVQFWALMASCSTKNNSLIWTKIGAKQKKKKRLGFFYHALGFGFFMLC